MTRMRANQIGLGVIGAVMVAAVMIASLFVTGPSFAQTLPNKLQGPGFIDDRSRTDPAILAKERFRRQAAESAQKQLERLAEQLHQQLGEEVVLRKAAEARIAELTTQIALTDQLDQERQRLRGDTINQLEHRGALLEREVAALTERVTEETARRRQLEKSADQLGAARDELLTARIKEIEAKLTAAEWARKLAEAQLKVFTAGSPKQ